MATKTERELLLDLNKKLEGVQKDLNSVDKTLVVLGSDVKYHIKRTDLAEERMDTFEEEIKPALDAYKFVAAFTKISMGVATFVGAIVGIWYYLK